MGEEYYKKIFSKNLRRLMYEQNKTQIDLINDLGFNKSAVSTWVNGSRLPRMDKVQQLADYFGCLRSDLIEDKQPDAKLLTLSDKERYIIDRCRMLNDDDLGYLSAFLEGLCMKYKKDTSSEAM